MADSTIAQHETIYMRQAAKHPVKLLPAGVDRAHLPFWHGLAGCCEDIVVANYSGRLTVVSTTPDLQKLLGSLDTRGVRERALHNLIAPIVAKRHAAAAKIQAVAAALAKEEEVCHIPHCPGYSLHQ
jgi:hypothetical protein